LTPPIIGSISLSAVSVAVQVIKVKETIGRESPLAGAINGASDRGALVAACSGASGALRIVDFSGLEVITSSYLVAAFSFLWEGRVPLEPVPVVYVNAGAHLAAELDHAFRAAGVAGWLGSWDGSRLNGVHPVGRLDEHEQLTLSVIAERGQASAPELAKNNEGIGATGWNNRLSKLWQFGLLRRIRKGRLHLYEIPWKD
jgi:hypothetical protein